VAQGRELLNQDKTEEAKLLFEKALQSEPENAAAHAALAALLTKQGRNLEALEHLRSAAQDGKPESQIALGRARLQAYLENPSSTALEVQAKDSARQLAAVPTAQSEAARIEGYLAVIENRTGDAIRHFQASLAKNAKQDDVRLSLLQQFLANSQETEALKLLPGTASGDALADTVYLHILAKDGCGAAETFLKSRFTPGQDIDASLKYAAHQRRCAGPAAEEIVLAPLRGNPKIGRAEALQLGDYDALQSNWPQALAMYDKAAALPEAPGAASIGSPAGASGEPSGAIELRRSSALIGVGRFEEASKILDAYIAKHPNDANAKGQRGLLRLNASLPDANPAAGLQDLREALAQPEAQTLPTLRLQLAMNLVRYGYLQEARRELQDLSRIMPGELAIALLGAEIALREGRPEAAEKYAREILVQSPKQREARLIRALSLSAMNISAEASGVLRELLAEYPNDESVAVQLAGALAAQPSPTSLAEALKLIETLESKPNLSPQSRYVIAEILYRTGNTAHEKRAVAIWERLSTGHSDVRARIRLTEIALGQGRGAELCPALDALAGAENSWPQPTRAQWWGLRGICAESRKDAQAALQAHRKALELSPKDPVFANNLASLMAEQGKDLDEARRLADLAVAADPENVQYRDTLGWVYYRRGDQNRARQIYQGLMRNGTLPQDVSARASQVLASR
jgi:tetratricopeptide (TPR) repeat protein